jgi:hypothetical protein
MTTVTDFTDGEDVDAFMLNSRTQALLRAILNPTALTAATDQAAGVLTTTSTTYTDTANVLSASFIAPPSGIVAVTVMGEIYNNTANFHNRMSYRLSGASTYNPADATKDSHAAMIYSSPQTAASTATRRSIRTGLTPGGSYVATAQWRTEGGTMSRERCTILVEPVWPLA